MKTLFALLSFACCVLLLAAPAAAEELAIELSPEILTAGEPVMIRDVSATNASSDFEILLESRPGSQIARSERLGYLHDGLAWTPAKAGLYRLRLVDAKGVELSRRDLAVRYRRLPISALLVLLAAGSLLFGGLSVGFRRIG